MSDKSAASVVATPIPEPQVLAQALKFTTAALGPAKAAFATKVATAKPGEAVVIVVPAGGPSP